MLTKIACFCQPNYYFAYLCIVKKLFAMKITKALSEKLNASGESEILFRFIGGRGMVLRAKSGIFVKPADWSEKTATKPAGLKTISKTAKMSEQKRLKEIDEKLTQLENTITAAFVSTPSEKIDKGWLETVIHDFHFPPTEDDEKEKSLFVALDEFIETEKKNWSESTRKHFVTLSHHLSRYKTETGNDVTFSSIDDDFVESFVGFLATSRGMRNSTMAKTYKQLKWFLRWTVNKGYNTNTRFEVIKPKGCKTKNKESESSFIVYLTDDELKAVREWDFSNNDRLDRVRDVFVFCCYTGLRYSDVEYLKRDNIYNNKLHVTTIKTGDTIEIDLNDVARSILDKYKDIEFKGNRALPVISNQKMNNFLKEMAMTCEIDQPITKVYFVGKERQEDTRPKYEWIGTHTGRRTFIVRGLSKGIAPDVMMKWTGHSDYNAMKPYIDITAEARESAMKLFND
jgi:integrase